LKKFFHRREKYTESGVLVNFIIQGRSSSAGRKPVASAAVY
jgi:hypothetical protein